MVTKLNWAFWHWCELVGRCYVHAETGDLPEEHGRSRTDGRALDPGETWVINGIATLERFVAQQSLRA
jgi:hypothetical protein